jgi:hypothetical protein
MSDTSNIKIENIKLSKKEAFLGSSVEILVNLNTAPDEAVISVTNPSTTEVVSEVDMTEVTNTIYSYVYQSDEDDVDGEYIFTLSFSNDTYTTIEQVKFTLVEQEP